MTESDTNYWHLSTLQEAQVCFDLKLIDRELFHELCFYHRQAIKRIVLGKAEE